MVCDNCEENLKGNTDATYCKEYCITYYKNKIKQLESLLDRYKEVFVGIIDEAVTEGYSLGRNEAYSTEVDNIITQIKNDFVSVLDEGKVGE